MDVPQLLDTVRAWAAVNYPGCPVEFITIHCRYLSVPIQLVAGPQVGSSPAPINREQAATDDQRGPALRQCVRDILRTLREAGRPLSRTRLLEEMGKRGMDWSESTVAGYLAQLMEDGTIENPEDARPRGYRMPPEEPPSAEQGNK